MPRTLLYPRQEVNQLPLIGSYFVGRKSGGLICSQDDIEHRIGRNEILHHRTIYRRPEFLAHASMLAN